MTATLHRHTAGSTLVLTIANPGHRNALSPDHYAAGQRALSEAEDNPAIRSVVLTGEGGHFCAGGNLQRLLGNRAQPPEVQARSIDGLHAWIGAVRGLSKPVVAAVEGACAGAGFSLALACDFLIASEDSVFVMAYANVALSPDGGGSWSLARQLPRATAMQWLMLGERVGAARLQALGLVNQVTPAGGALARALELCERLNAQAPNALASIKGLVNAADQQPLSAHLDQERDAFVRNLHHPNGGEGIQAFLDKRTAQYR